MMQWPSSGAWPVRSMDHILDLGNLARVTQEIGDPCHLAYLVMQTSQIEPVQFMELQMIWVSSQNAGKG
jgi:hypothetical protein